MEFELDLIDSLGALGYSGHCLKSEELGRVLEGGHRNAEFRKLVLWLTEELHILRKTDEHVAELKDASEFALELSAMLKELGCPYKQFITGSLSERFEKREDCALLLEFLTTELMATKMSLHLRPLQKTMTISKTETDTARALQTMSQELGLGKPPDNVKPKAFFDKLNFKLEEAIRRAKPGVLSEPLMRTPKLLSDDQWKKLEAIHASLDEEYNLRRTMLLTRLEMTVQSFRWSDKARSRENDIVKIYQQKMQELDALRYGNDDTTIIALLASRADLAIIEKTSSANVRKNTASKIQKHVIGSVPDRGGRANEHAPPPPEMPSWQQQRAGGQQGGGGNFRGGRGGGGRGRGGGGSSSGHWQQYSSAPQQRQQPFEQRSQFERGSNQNWVDGNGRVQGSGWTQRNNNEMDRGNNNYHGNHDRSGRGGGGGGNYRGRSNYNRGGGGSGGGGSGGGGGHWR